MRKRKPIILAGETVDQTPFGPRFVRKTKIEWVGPTKRDSEYIGYMRLECDGVYLGVPTQAQLRQLKRWIDAALV